MNELVVESFRKNVSGRICDIGRLFITKEEQLRAFDNEIERLTNKALEEALKEDDVLWAFSIARMQDHKKHGIKLPRTSDRTVYSDCLVGELIDLIFLISKDEWITEIVNNKVVEVIYEEYLNHFEPKSTSRLMRLESTRRNP